MVASDSVCVVGAGPAGLVTAKVFLDDGFDVTVYEKYDEIGGTWSPYRRYVNLNHQLPKGIFEFSDMPRNEAYEDAEAVQAYLRTYADRFGVTDRIQFETEVLNVTSGSDGWTVKTTRDGGGSTDRTQFDYVTVCSGLHHLPSTPDVPGLDQFDGIARHSSSIHDEELLEDRRIAVVGGGKSAWDLSVEAGKLGRSTTLVFRKANWMTPKKLFGGLVPNRYVLYTRFGESLQPRYYNEDCVRLIDRIPEPVKDSMWKLVHKDLVRSAGLHKVDDDLVPETDMRYDYIHAGVRSDEFTDLVESGAIVPVKASVERAEAGGIRLSNGEFVEADVVVFATGFRKEVPFVDDLDLKTDDGRFYLYRSLVPPGADDIGFVGTRETFNNFLSMEVSAHWLAAFFQDELVEMPSTEEMRERIDRRLEWQGSMTRNTQGFHFGAYDLHCVDELLLDMGVSTRRERNPVAEYLLPRARARHYAELKAERKRAAADTASRGETGSIFRSIASSFLP